MYGHLCEPWPHVWCGSLDGVNPAVTGFAMEAASEVLWMATGRRFGNCPITLRPCRRDCPDIPGDLTWSNGILSSLPNSGGPLPVLTNGLWINLACGICVGECACTSFSEVLLAEKVQEVTEVSVDGVAVTGYEVYDGQRLVRTDGGEWPRCQDWTRTEGDGVWTVTASFGAPVPQLGQIAAGVLGLEIAKLCCGMDCNLPPQVTKVTRQGVTMERLNPSDVLQDGLTGLYLPDMFIRRFNPNGLMDRARAYSPDVPSPRVVTP